MLKRSAAIRYRGFQHSVTTKSCRHEFKRCAVLRDGQQGKFLRMVLRWNTTQYPAVLAHRCLEQYGVIERTGCPNEQASVCTHHFKPDGSATLDQFGRGGVIGRGEIAQGW